MKVTGIDESMAGFTNLEKACNNTGFRFAFQKGRIKWA